MAVLIQATAVIARRSAVEDKLPGGVQAWFERAPNQTACADRHLCAMGFMGTTDAFAFVRELEQAGLEVERGGVARDVVVVDPSGRIRHECSWIDAGPYCGVTAAWLTATEPEPLVVPLGYRPTDGVFSMTEEEAATRLEFVRNDGMVEVYRDRETGKEVYRGRTTRAQPPSEAVQARLRELFATIDPMLTNDGRPPRLGWRERRRLRKAIAELEQHAASLRAMWNVWWFLGMARRSAGDPEGAYEAFRVAYRAGPNESAVMREYSGQCLALGLGSEAVALARRNCAAHPDDAGLRSNLALALMVADDMPAAAEECAKARAMEPDDPVTAALERMIDDVIAGRRDRPTRYP